MSSAPSMRVSEQEHFHLEDTSDIERSIWVLNPPNPPPLRNKLFSPLKKTVSFFSSKKKTCLGHAVSFLESLFPILTWFTNYKASKFKEDLLAGLTLASLSIPQVYRYSLTLASNFMQCISDVEHLHYITVHSNFYLMLQSIGYANLAKLDPQYGLCRYLTSVIYILIFIIYTTILMHHASRFIFFIGLHCIQTPVLFLHLSML